MSEDSAAPSRPGIVARLMAAIGDLDLVHIGAFAGALALGIQLAVSFMLPADRLPALVARSGEIIAAQEQRIATLEADNASLKIFLGELAPVIHATAKATVEHRAALNGLITALRPSIKDDPVKPSKRSAK